MRLKSYLLAIAAIALLSACTSDELFDSGAGSGGDGDGKFHFSPQGTWIESKATSGSTGTTFNHPDFAVFGAMTDEANFASSSHNFNWMYKAKIGKDASGWVHQSGAAPDEYYFDLWSPNALHSFFAIAPYSAAVSGTSHLTPAIIGDKKNITMDFAVPTDHIETGVDLMYASTTNIRGKGMSKAADGDGTQNYPAGGKVVLDFKHALSQVSFNVKIDPASSHFNTTKTEKLHIHAIRFLNVKYNGKMKIADDGTITWPNEDLGSYGNVGWFDHELKSMSDVYWVGSDHDPATAPDKKKYIPWNSTDGYSPIPYIKGDFVDGADTHIALMIPQTFTSEAKIELDYHLDSKSAESGHPEIYTVSYSLPAALPLIESGKNYLFNMTLKIDAKNALLHVEALDYDWDLEDQNVGIDYEYFNLIDDQRVYNVDFDGVVKVPMETNFTEDDLRNGKVKASFLSGRTIPDGAFTKTGEHEGLFTFKAPTKEDAAAMTPPYNTKEILRMQVNNTMVEIVFNYGTYEYTNSTPGVEGHVQVNPATGDSYIHLKHDYDDRVTPYSIPFKTTFPLSSFADIECMNGGTASIVVNGDGTTGQINYQRPAGWEHRFTYDRISYTINGAKYILYVMWSYFTPTLNHAKQDLVSDPTGYTYILNWPLTHHELTLPFKTNLLKNEFTIVQENILAGTSSFTVNTPTLETGHAVYKRTTLSQVKDMLTMNAGPEKYKLKINFPYLKIANPDGKTTWTVQRTKTVDVTLEYGGNADLEAALESKFGGEKEIKPGTILLSASEMEKTIILGTTNLNLEHNNKFGEVKFLSIDAANNKITMRYKNTNEDLSTTLLNDADLVKIQFNGYELVVPFTLHHGNINE